MALGFLKSFYSILVRLKAEARLERALVIIGFYSILVRLKV